MGRPATDTSCRSEVGQRQSAEEQARGYRLKLRHAAALALVGWYVMLPPQTRAQPSTLTIRPALLPVPNVMNLGADPATFRPAPLNVVLHQYISLPSWVKANEFDDLREWLTEQGFVIVRANGPEPWRTYPQ
jgi:hypothetical protein